MFNLFISKRANIPINKNQIIIVKETGLEIYATEIKKLFPSSKFIQLIRDPQTTIHH